MNDELLHVVVILHGAPDVPWLACVRDDPRLAVHLIVNDPGPGRYRALPPAMDVHVNEAPLGYAENVNRALRRLSDRVNWKHVLLANFDLEIDQPGDVFLALRDLCRAPVGLVGPCLVDPSGRVTHSVGRAPTPLAELSRAMGVRSGAWRAVARTLLRSSRRWASRNQAAPGQGRLLGPGEYLPWTCVALSRQAWDDVGPLDADRFWMYGEDVDWSWRAAQVGYRSLIGSVGRVVHVESATAGAFTTALMERSMRELHDKWESGSCSAWHRTGMILRRYSPLRFLTSDLGWSVYDAGDWGEAVESGLR